MDISKQIELMGLHKTANSAIYDPYGRVSRIQKRPPPPELTREDRKALDRQARIARLHGMNGLWQTIARIGQNISEPFNPITSEDIDNYSNRVSRTN